ncbi:MAG: hypothetical protein DMD82_14420 [Candidatus Rokuibacteriota bacterium]|nr:MAG: hypothetical protein DMD82_14420 [Candidatus Rokubacteria bacterium]
MVRLRRHIAGVASTRPSAPAPGGAAALAADSRGRRSSRMSASAMSTGTTVAPYASRQPQRSASHGTRSSASVPPTPPPAEKRPVTRPRSSRGNHSVMSRMPGTQTAAAPSPTSARDARLAE